MVKFYSQHCLKRVQIRNFFWSVFFRIPTEYGKILKILRISPYSVHISSYSVQLREDTDQKKLRIWTLFTQCKSPLSQIFKSREELMKILPHSNFPKSDISSKQIFPKMGRHFLRLSLKYCYFKQDVFSRTSKSNYLLGMYWKSMITKISFQMCHLDC